MNGQHREPSYAARESNLLSVSIPLPPHSFAHSLLLVVDPGKQKREGSIQDERPWEPYYVRNPFPIGDRYGAAHQTHCMHGQRPQRRDCAGGQDWPKRVTAGLAFVCWHVPTAQFIPKSARPHNEFLWMPR
jgi:hypothetical protein